MPKIQRETGMVTQDKEKYLSESKAMEIDKVKKFTEEVAVSKVFEGTPTSFSSS